MKMKVVAIAGSVVALIGSGFFVPTVSEGKGFSSSRSSSFSRSSYRSSSYSSTKGSFWGSSKSKTSKKNTSTFKKPTVKKTKPITPKHKWRQHKAKFTEPVKTVSFTKVKEKYGDRPLYKKASANVDYQKRSSFYTDTWKQPPTYVYNSSPSYGMWNTLFLYWMLNNNNAAQFAYNHQNDPDFIAWKKDAEIQAANNAELKAKLEQMEKQMATMSGTPNPDYLPPNVTPDIALSDEVLGSKRPTFNMCVGEKDGAYYRLTHNYLTKQDIVNYQFVTTHGSLEELDYIADGKCDGAWVQRDSYWVYVEQKQKDNLPFEREISPYNEALHFICNGKSGYTNLDDLDKRSLMYIVTKSGAEVSWTNVVTEEPNYKAIQTKKVSDYTTALTKVMADKNSCMLYVAAPGGTAFMRKADSAAVNKKLVLLEADDWDLNDKNDPSGAPIYTFVTLTPSQYPNLLANNSWLWRSNAVEVPATPADIIISTAWIKKYPNQYQELKLDLWSKETLLKQQATLVK